MRMLALLRKQLADEFPSGDALMNPPITSRGGWRPPAPGGYSVWLENQVSVGPKGLSRTYEEERLSFTHCDMAEISLALTGICLRG